MRQRQYKDRYRKQANIASIPSISATNFNNTFQCDEKMKTVSSSCRSFHSAFPIFPHAGSYIEEGAFAVGWLEYQPVFSVVGFKSNIFPTEIFLPQKTLVLGYSWANYFSAPPRCSSTSCLLTSSFPFCPNSGENTSVKSSVKRKQSHIIRENFPNVEHYEFSETNLHSMNQLNALAQVGRQN